MEMEGTEAPADAKKMYDEQYVSEWHNDLQSECMTRIFMPDGLEGIS